MLAPQNAMGCAFSLLVNHRVEATKTAMHRKPALALRRDGPSPEQGVRAGYCRF